MGLQDGKVLTACEATLPLQLNTLGIFFSPAHIVLNYSLAINHTTMADACYFTQFNINVPIPFLPYAF